MGAASAQQTVMILIRIIFTLFEFSLRERESHPWPKGHYRYRDARSSFRNPHPRIGGPPHSFYQPP
jgi:hypothetical protein